MIVLVCIVDVGHVEKMVLKYCNYSNQNVIIIIVNLKKNNRLHLFSEKVCGVVYTE